jgi:hypothetical protein
LWSMSMNAFILDIIGYIIIIYIYIYIPNDDSTPSSPDIWIHYSYSCRLSLIVRCFPYPYRSGPSLCTFQLTGIIGLPICNGGLLGYVYSFTHTCIRLGHPLHGIVVEGVEVSTRVIQEVVVTPECGQYPFQGLYSCEVTSLLSIDNMDLL